MKKDNSHFSGFEDMFMYTDVFHMYTSSGVREMAAVQQIRNQTLVMAKNNDYKRVVEEMRTIARLTGRQV